MRGPIDYIIVGFTGNKFDGSVLRTLEEAIEKGVIALVALSFVQKDGAGNVTTIDVAEMGDEYMVEFTEKYKTDNSVVTSEDIEEVSDLLEENTAAGLLVIEQLWAKPLKKALIDVGGFLLAEGRIHPDAAAELNVSEEV